MGSDQPIKNCTIKYEWWTEAEHKPGQTTGEEMW